MRRLVLALSRASMVALVIGLTAAASVVSPIGTRRIARETAERELSALLLSGERVLARTFASQRRPSDLWRLSHGLLVATDRRLLYVGAPPVTLLRPVDGGPLALYLESWPYESAFVMSVDSTSDTKRVLLRTPDRAVTLRVDDGAIAATSAIAQVATRERRRVSDDAARVQRSGIAPVQPERYTTHVIERGQTLTSIARQYNSSIDVLRQLNGLRDDDVRAGQRLRVPALPQARANVVDSTP